MSLEYIRQYYNVPAYEGARVTWCGDPAVIVGASRQYLILHFEGQDKPSHAHYHPTWETVYLEQEEKETQ